VTGGGHPTWGSYGQERETGRTTGRRRLAVRGSARGGRRDPGDRTRVRPGAQARGEALANAGPPVIPPDPEDKKPPRYGTARKAGPGATPRICHPLERAGEGQKRFKIVARIGRQIGNWPYRYILAETRDEAVAFYLDHQKIDRAAKDDKGNDLIQCTVTELPD
jgi:hypothetical protein